MIERIMADTDDGRLTPGFIVDPDCHFIVSALSPNQVMHNGKKMNPGATLIPGTTTEAIMVVHVVQLIRQFCTQTNMTPDEFLDRLNSFVNTNQMLRPRDGRN